MKYSPYQSYTDIISEALKSGKRTGQLGSSLSSNAGNVVNLVKSLDLADRSKDEIAFNSLNALSNITGKKVKYHQKPGAHPDFLHIKEQNTIDYHSITSMFIDISKSTNLFKRYEPLAVANITMTIQRAAIHTAWYFDAYIQRFHGDGLLIYFGGKNVPLAQATQNALNAASFFTYFVKNDLKHVFLEQGVEDIYTRIGIDMGMDNDVLWHLAGMSECSEITTCSLHTSLAAHMQGNASTNGIMVGDNVKQYSNLMNDLYSIKKDSHGNEDRYIFQIPEESFNYTQWDFNWEKYLNNHPSVRLNENGELVFTGHSVASVISEPKNIEFLKRQVEGYRPSFNG